MTIRKRELAEDEVHELLRKFKDGDITAFTKLYEHLYPKVYAYVYYRVNSVQDAEDLTSDVFIKAIENLREQKGSFDAWIFRIACNRVIDHYRRRSVRQNPLNVEDKNLGSEDFDAIMEGHFFQQEFKQALTQLTHDQQEVIILKLVEGYKTDEIAAMLDKSVEAIRALQFRALSTLRTLLDAKRGEKRKR